jgi:hypothetical protein
MPFNGRNQALALKTLSEMPAQTGVSGGLAARLWSSHSHRERLRPRSPLLGNGGLRRLLPHVGQLQETFKSILNVKAGKPVPPHDNGAFQI